MGDYGDYYRGYQGGTTNSDCSSSSLSDSYTVCCPLGKTAGTKSVWRTLNAHDAGSWSPALWR